MFGLEEIKNRLQRYVLRIDNERRYSKIIEIPKYFLNDKRELNLHSKSHIEIIFRDGILHEVNYQNLKKVILNPKSFLVVDHKEIIGFLENAEIKDSIESSEEAKNILRSVGHAKSLLKLLDYKHILPDTIIEEFRKGIREQFLYALNEFKTKEKPGYSGELEFLYDDKLYLCCNELGPNYFDDLIIELHTIFIERQPDYLQARFIAALLSFRVIEPLDNTVLRKTSHTSPWISNDDNPVGSPASISKYIIVIAFFGCMLCGYLYTKSPIADEKKEVSLPFTPTIRFFQIFGFDQKRVMNNQYNDLNVESCEFKIENTQFNNSTASSDRYKEIILFNKSEKDIIVVWFNGKDLSYTFLSAKGSFSTLRPVNGMLKLYAGKEPEMITQWSADNTAIIDFRFGIFTRQDSLLLTRDFDLKEIESTERQFILDDNNGSITIKDRSGKEVP